MFEQLPREKERTSWFFVLLWVLSIYTSIPIARRIHIYVRDNIGSELFLWIVGLYLGLGFLIAIAGLVRRLGQKSILRVVYLLLIAGAFGYWMWALSSRPERTMHFLQYGTLGLLVYRALLFRLRSWLIYPVTAVVCALFGTLDEIIQWITPDRVFDYNDIAINFGAAALSQVAIAAAIRPAVVNATVTTGHLRLFVRVFSAQALLIGFCLSNTAERIQWYAEKLPVIAHVTSKPAMMAEYGHFHRLDNGISFYSRFTLAELKQIDTSRGDATGALLASWVDTTRYGDFLRTYPPQVDALAYEARVRLFRLQRHKWKAKNNQHNQAAFRTHALAAYVEHRILSEFYPRTYRASTMKLSPSDETFLSEKIDDIGEVTSPVSSQLITSYSSGDVWGGIFLLLVGLHVAAAIIGRRYLD